MFKTNTQRCAAGLLAASALIFATPVTALDQETAAPSAATILDQYVEATGGKAAYAKIQNRVTHGTFEILGQGITFDMTVYAARPNKVYSRFESEAMGTIERGTDGVTAWESSMMTGPSVKEGQEKAEFLRDATFDALVYWRDVFERAEFAGEATVGERPCVKVSLVPAVGKPRTLYFDYETHLLLKTDLTAMTQMGEIPLEIVMSDYKEVDGLQFPHTVTITVLGQQRVMKTTSIEHNVDLPADRFELPEEVAALAAAAVEPSSEK